MEDNGFFDTITASNGGIIMWFSHGLGVTEGTPGESYNYFSGYGFEPGWYVGGPPWWSFSYFPFSAVVDLNTGIVLGRDVGEVLMTDSEIIALVQEANGE